MDDHPRELLAFYALDAVSESERRQVEAYLAENPEALAELKALRAAAHQLPLSIEPATPPAAVAAGLMARIRADHRDTAGAVADRPEPRLPGRRPAFRRSWWTRFRQGPALPAVAGLALLAALLLPIWIVSLQARVRDLTAENDALRQQLLTQQETVAVLTGFDSRVITINGTEARPQARGELVVEAGAGRAVLVVTDLAPLPGDQTYQLWLIQGDSPVSAGTFQVDAQGRGLFPVTGAPLPSFDAVGVSIEPAGGSAAPTGDIVLLGG